MQTIDGDFSNVISNIILLLILMMSYAFHSNFSTQVSPCALVYITSDALNFEVNTVLYYYCIYFEI